MYIHAALFAQKNVLTPMTYARIVVWYTVHIENYINRIILYLRTRHTHEISGLLREMIANNITGLLCIIIVHTHLYIYI